MSRAPSLRLDFPWTLAVCGLGALATACSLGVLGPAGERLAAWLTGDAGRLWSGELWRAVTGPLVHATSGHLFRDLAVCLIVGAGYERPLRRRWPLLCLSTLAIPTLAMTLPGSAWSGYGGLSGMSHGLIAAALAYELRVRRGARWYLHVALALFLGKLTYETVTGAPLFPMPLGPGVAQAPLAHTAGALAGAAAVLLWPTAGLSLSRLSAACPSRRRSLPWRGRGCRSRPPRRLRR